MTMTEAARTVAVHMRVTARKAIENGWTNRMRQDPVLFAQEVRTELLRRGVITVEPHWHTIRSEYRKLFN